MRKLLVVLFVLVVFMPTVYAASQSEVSQARLLCSMSKTDFLHFVQKLPTPKTDYFLLQNVDTAIVRYAGSLDALVTNKQYKKLILSRRVNWNTVALKVYHLLQNDRKTAFELCLLSLSAKKDRLNQVIRKDNNPILIGQVDFMSGMLNKCSYDAKTLGDLATNITMLMAKSLVDTDFSNQIISKLIYTLLIHPTPHRIRTLFNANIKKVFDFNPDSLCNMRIIEN